MKDHLTREYEYKTQSPEVFRVIKHMGEIMFSLHGGGDSADSPVDKFKNKFRAYPEFTVTQGDPWQGLGNTVILEKNGEVVCDNLRALSDEQVEAIWRPAQNAKDADLRAYLARKDAEAAELASKVAPIIEGLSSPEIRLIAAAVDWQESNWADFELKSEFAPVVRFRAEHEELFDAIADACVGIVWKERKK